MPMVPSAAPAALREEISTAISPPRKQVRAPMVAPAMPAIALTPIIPDASRWNKLYPAREEDPRGVDGVAVDVHKGGGEGEGPQRRVAQRQQLVLNTEPRASTSSCGSSRMTLMDGKPLLCGESCMNSTSSTTPAAPSAAVDR